MTNIKAPFQHHFCAKTKCFPAPVLRSFLSSEALAKEDRPLCQIHFAPMQYRLRKPRRYIRPPLMAGEA
jgi:hypothetical protein